jgi:F-type H+-transporting ATPase subunit b
MNLRARWVGAAAGAASTILAHPAWIHASDAAHGEGHAPGIGSLLFPAINFAIYVFIVVWFVIPALRDFLRRRGDDIVSAARESASALAVAEKKLADAKQRQNGLAAERETLRRDLVAAETRQAERLQVDAVASGKRRVADAGVVADQERQRALADVRAEIAALATEIAESRLRSALSADDQRAYVQQFLKDAPRR